MNKDDFLKTIAVKGYDVGFGAKKNFSSFDIINKLPNWIGFISLGIGIIQVAYENICFSKELSILLILVSIAILYIDVFRGSLDEYKKEGTRLTIIFNELRDLYLKAKSDNTFLYANYENDYKNILTNFYSNTITKQVFLSHWYAHFKFFYELQIEWIDEQLAFKFFKDKLPNSLKISLLIIFIIVIILIIANGNLSNICSVR